MQFKDIEEFEKIHFKICPGETYGGRTWFNREYRFCKLCSSFYRGHIGNSGRGQLDSKMVKARLERIDTEMVEYFRQKARENFRKMGIDVHDEFDPEWKGGSPAVPVQT